MRVSTDKNDKGYIYDAYNHYVFLDGVELKHCFTADEELGEAHCYVVDKDDKLVIDDSGENIKTEILKGKVKIIKRK